MHKNRPLVKPMIIVSSTGYILSILGPYLADHKNNDAGILKHNLKTNMENMNEWIQPGDVLIVDRGFRDASEMLDDFGIQAEMPKFLPKGQKQFTTEEANASRLVTKIRWVVESVNGRLKQWKYLQNVVPNIQIPYIGDNVKLIGAICNKYKPPLSTGEKDNDQILAAKMRVLSRKKNDLQERVEREGLHRRICSWKKIDADDSMPCFPMLSEEELRNITVGVYQLKLAKSYTQEHLNDESEFIIMINSDLESILRVQIQSRHTSARKYLIWIEYDEIEVLEL
ncbi:uncharacterized protein LOC127733747 [Mytilus californianus]|uniref:uncharacterized protein LOC127733747 n=1 Tax=Mytilus californianus TaxID=6549 RepID=UPI002246E68E|nr:uncharacterized protein LOC127733747 [Mytilus californianus]